MKNNLSTPMRNNISGLIVIPLRQGNCKTSECIVEIGKEIVRGEKLGNSRSTSELNIYSSVCGRVVAIDKMVNTYNGAEPSVLIQASDDQSGECDIQMLPTTDENLIDNIRQLGLMGYDRFPLSNAFENIPPSQISGVGVMLFDEYSGIGVQEYLISNNAEKIIHILNEFSQFFGVHYIDIYIPKRMQNANELKATILEHAIADNVRFVTVKTPRHKNNYEYFAGYVAKNNLSAHLIQTPETFLDLYEGLKNHKPKTSKWVYIGGKATQLNDGYLSVPIGSSLDHIKDMCGGLVMEEQEIEDLKSDTIDYLDDMYDAEERYKQETDKSKRAELKQAYVACKKRANHEIWQFIKTQRANLMKTIRQIRIGSVHHGQIFTDFSAILEPTDSAVYFLNRGECRR